MEAVQQAKETTATDLGWLLDASEDAVVTLIAGETRLLAHRAVLTDRSPVFAAMFQHDMLEACSGSVNIPDVEGPVLRELLAYLYCLQAPQLPGTASQLLAAADKYGLSALKEACERQVAAQLSVETAAAAAVLAIRHSCGGLRRAAIDFIKSHLAEVMATQGYADAVRMQPEDVVELGRLLYEISTTAPAPAPAPADSGTPATPATAAPQPLSDHGGRRQTPASAAPPTAAAHHGSPPEEAADSRVRRPDTVDRATSTTPDLSGRRQTPASAAPPTAAAHHRSPPDVATDCRTRQLSAEEKNRRLIEAAEQRAVGELEALLAAGADVAARGEDMWTALHWAAAWGHEEAARRLLAAGAAVGARGSDQWTPLHVAAANGHAAVVRLLLTAGADHGARDVDGWTPLHWAAYSGHTEAAAALLEGGADRAARDDEGRTPLDRARRNKKRQVVALLEGR